MTNIFCFFMKKIIYIDEVEIKNKTVLLRADFDVSLNPDQTIADDVRIQKNIPTIRHLLKMTIDLFAWPNWIVQKFVIRNFH